MHVRGRGGAGVVGGVGVEEGFLGEGFQRGFGDVEVFDRVGDFEGGAQFQDPVEDAVEAVEVEGLGKGADAGFQRRAVIGEDIGHEHGVGEAVMGVEMCADRVAERVDGAEAFLEGGRAHGGGGEHIAAGGDVARVMGCGDEAGFDEADAFDGDAVSDGVPGGDAEGLQAMGEGVHAGPGGEAGGQAEGEFGVEDHEPWQHLRV